MNNTPALSDLIDRTCPPIRNDDGTTTPQRLTMHGFRSSFREWCGANDDVIARKLYPMALVPIASRAYLEANLPLAGPGGEGLAWIGWDKAERRPDWVAGTAFPNAEVRHATTDPVLQLSLARQGVGMITSSVYFTTVYPELIPVPGVAPKLDRNLWLLFHTELRRTTRVRRFIDFLSKELIGLKPLLQAGLDRQTH